MSKVRRVWYVLHELGDDGKFRQSQHHRDFPERICETQAKEELERELGSHLDESWRSTKGFVVVSTSTIMEPSQIPAGDLPTERITEVDLFPPIAVRAFSQTKKRK